MYKNRQEYLVYLLDSKKNQRLSKACQKDTGANSKTLPLAKDGTI